MDLRYDCLNDSVINVEFVSYGKEKFEVNNNFYKRQLIIALSVGAMSTGISLNRRDFTSLLYLYIS